MRGSTPATTSTPATATSASATPPTRSRSARGQRPRDGRRAVEHVDRARRTARPEAVPQGRGGDQPRPRDVALPDPPASRSPRCTAGSSTRASRWRRRSGSSRPSSPTGATAGSWRWRRSSQAGRVPGARRRPRSGHGRAAQRARLRPGDPAFSPEEPSVEALGLLTATIDEDIERLFVRLGDDEQSLRSAAAARTFASGSRRARSRLAGRAIRIHGDYHLGQTLRRRAAG